MSLLGPVLKMGLTTSQWPDVSVWAHLTRSRFSQQMRISTAPHSRALRVSTTPKQYFPVSWLISSKYLAETFSTHSPLMASTNISTSSHLNNRIESKLSLKNVLLWQWRYWNQYWANIWNKQHFPQRKPKFIYSPMSFFSWINLTLARDSAASSMAWLKPFSPP